MAAHAVRGQQQPHQDNRKLLLSKLIARAPAAEPKAQRNAHARNQTPLQLLQEAVRCLDSIGTDYTLLGRAAALAQGMRLNISTAEVVVQWVSCTTAASTPNSLLYRLQS